MTTRWIFIPRADSPKAARITCIDCGANFESFVFNHECVKDSAAWMQIARDAFLQGDDRLAVRVICEGVGMGEGDAPNAKWILGEILAAYISLVEGMRSPVWQKPSEHKLDGWLEHAHVLRRRIAEIGP